MITALLLPPVTTSGAEYFWLAVVFLFLVGVVLPAVWSTHPPRRRAAMAVIQAVLDVIASITTVLHGRRRL
jgi:bacteriorhodopsin